jgi:signal transduction histidine kinase
MTAVAASDPSVDARRLDRTVLPTAIGIVALAVGIVAIMVGTTPGAAGLSLAGASWAGPILELAAGWSLTAVGLESVRRGRRTFGLSLALAGIAWFLPYLALPHVGSSIAFTVGLVLGSVFPVLIAQALLAAGTHVTDRRPERAIVLIGYLLLGLVAGLIPALTFSPDSTFCTFCPANVLAIIPSAGVGESAARIASLVAIGWATLVIVVLVVRLRRQGAAARRLQAPYLAAGVLFFVVTAVGWLRLALVAAPATDAVGHAIRLSQAVAIVALAGGVGLEWVQVRRARIRVARMVADLGGSPPPGGLRDALADMLRDPDLRIGYPAGTDRFVDVTGGVVAFGQLAGRRQTPLVRDDVTVAVLDHRSDVLEHAAEGEEVVRAARLGLEHERLQAEARVRLDELVAARRRIVVAAEATRRALERDLHDGAQQRLIALAMGLRLLSPPPEDRPHPVDALLHDAAAEIAAALDELREVAHGIFPSVLADEGLRAAVEGLAEGSTVPVRIELGDERLGDDVEATAYHVIADTLRAATGPLTVAGQRQDGRYMLTVGAVAGVDAPVGALRDRIAAVGGSIAAERSTDGSLTLHVELPCVS